jgi:hypothetical protein
LRNHKPTFDFTLIASPHLLFL